MNEPQAAKLIGWMDPAPDRPGFVVPLLRVPGSNRLLSQTIDANDRVMGFREIDPAQLHESDQVIQSAIGELSLWGYAFPGEAAQITNRPQLASWLTNQIDRIDDPLLRLQAVEFCELGGEMREAWRSAHRTLARHAPRSADAWRDLVVIPARARQAVHRAIIDHHLDVSVEDLGRDVAVNVVDNRVELVLESKLYKRLTDRSAAIAQITDGTASLREAFALDAIIATHERNDPIPLALPTHKLLDPILVAIGSEAIETLGHIMPKLGQPGWRVTKAHVQAPGKADELSLVITSGEQLLHSGSTRVETIEKIIDAACEGAAADILFLFASRPRDRGNVHEACRLASALDRASRNVIAAIPHLPEPALAQPQGDWPPARDAILEAFDAIAFVSDHSPHSRGGIALGPARSISAAADRLVMLVDRLAAEDVELTSLPRLRGGHNIMRVNVFSSAVDPKLKLPSMLEQTLMRAMDPSVDLHGGASATLIGSRHISQLQLEAAQPLLVKERIRLREIVQRTGTGPIDHARQLHIQLSDVRWLGGEADDFESYCRRELEQLGWAITPSSAPHCAFVAMQDSRSIDIALASSFYSPFPQGQRGTGRAVMHDCVVLTQAQVRRSMFAEHLLRGWMPLHFSRMRALAPIFNRRYGTLIKALQKPTRATVQGLERAAFRHFQSTTREQLDTGVSLPLEPSPQSKWSLDPGRRFTFIPAPDAIMVELPVLKRSDDGEPSVRYQASILLSRTGWQLGHLGQP